MEDKKSSSAAVTINIDSADWHLGIANALVALHRTHGLDIQPFLTEFDRLNQKNGVVNKEGPKEHSKAGAQIAKFVASLVSQDDRKEL